jgi:hypothetical protein
MGGGRRAAVGARRYPAGEANQDWSELRFRRALRTFLVVDVEMRGRNRRVGPLVLRAVVQDDRLGYEPGDFGCGARRTRAVRRRRRAGERQQDREGRQQRQERTL